MKNVPHVPVFYRFFGWPRTTANKAVAETESAILGTAGVGMRRMKSPKPVEIRTFTSCHRLFSSIRIG
jgi:hypothetical protein